ncbi:Hypothetical predicted protein, partial [Paramuricea clavata]
ERLAFELIPPVRINIQGYKTNKSAIWGRHIPRLVECSSNKLLLCPQHQSPLVARFLEI